MDKFAVELTIREDFSFMWESDGEEFKVVVENCAINIKKIGLFAIKGLVKNRMGWNINAEDSPVAISIPFDRSFEILAAYQMKCKVKVKSCEYNPICIGAFTEPVHGW